MVEIPDRLRCLFSATLERRGDSYLLEVPHEELDEGEVTNGETYRIALLPQVTSQPGTGVDDGRQQRSMFSKTGERAPPVEKGEVCEVTIETLGDQGDGIAKIDRGYVVIVPGTRPDDEVTVEIQRVLENVAFAEVHATDSTVTDEDPAKPEDSLANEAFDNDE